MKPTRARFSILLAGLLAVGFAPGLWAQSPDTLILGLRECEALALKNNPLVTDARLSVQKAELDYQEAVAAAVLPKFELTNMWGLLPRARARYTENGVLTSPDTSTGLSDLRPFTQLDVEMVQPLYTFGKLKNLRQAAASGIEVSEAQIEKRKEEVRLLVRKFYWGIVLGNELLHVLEDVRHRMDEAEEKINEKLDEGSEEVSQNDLFKLQIFRYQVEKQYRSIVENLQIATTSLLATMGMDRDRPFRPRTRYLEPVPFVPDSVDYYVQLALQRHPDLTGLQAGLSASRALIGVSRSEYYPQFFLAGGLKFNYAPGRDDPKNPWVYNPTNYFRPGVLLGLKMNLNFRQTRHKVQKAETRYRSLVIKKSLLAQKLAIDVRKKYLEVMNAQADIDESNRALKASENWLRSVSMSFDLSLAEVKELIDAYKANSQMQGEHLRNIFNFNIRLAELSQQIGMDLYPEKLNEEE